MSDAHPLNAHSTDPSPTTPSAGASRPGELAGLRAVVTGAATGIGRATALELASAGAAVFLHARHSAEALDSLAAEIRALGSQATTYLCDLADPAQHAPLVERAWQWQAGLDIWVNNAGVDVLTGPAAAWSFERKLAALLEVDLAATIALSRLVGQRMQQQHQQRQQSPQQQQRCGLIINTGWDQSAHGMEGDSGQLFAAVKGAVTAFSRSLAKSLAPQVRVNVVAPGWIQTAWGEQAPPQWQARARREALLDRWGTPADVARVTRFLASDAASFVNAQVIDVNGGFRTHG